MPEELKFDAELQKWMSADPFVPFSLIFTSGDRYPITDPGMAFHESLQLAIGHTALVLIMPRQGIQLVRKNQITAVHVHERV
ncbi:MAG TPA: hypothetical protein VFE47_14225 [Tepidisphaeraceae bacterium]|jgi:hypothetical protein|nr:hypothetical protein [Tepidisphaeraceae bacterium]